MKYFLMFLIFYLCILLIYEIRKIYRIKRCLKTLNKIKQWNYFCQGIIKDYTKILKDYEL